MKARYMCEYGNQERADMQRQLTSGSTPVRLLVARNGDGGEETGAREIEEMCCLCAELILIFVVSKFFCCHCSVCQNRSFCEL